jgi:aminoglycoside N3'-acetyltransferase
MNRVDIEKCLVNIGIKQGMFLEVHSSLSSIGTVEGGASSVISAFMNIITKDGLLIMPSFLVKSLPLSEQDKALGISSKSKILSEDHNERTDMGIIADTFRKTDGVITGKGPHRFSAWGNDQKKYIENFNLFIKSNSYALLIGVDIESLSAMHFVEHNIPEHIWPKLFPPSNPDVNKYYNRNEWFIKIIGRTPYQIGWLNVQKEALSKGLINNCKIGNSNCMLFKIDDIVGIYESRLKNDINHLFEI